MKVAAPVAALVMVAMTVGCFGGNSAQQSQAQAVAYHAIVKKVEREVEHAKLASGVLSRVSCRVGPSVAWCTGTVWHSPKQIAELDAPMFFHVEADGALGSPICGRGVSGRIIANVFC